MSQSTAATTLESNAEVNHIALPAETEAPGRSQPVDEPVVVIKPGRQWTGVNLKEVWAGRELLLLLTLRDVQVRYKQTALGVTWAILQPLLTMVLFTLLFGRLAGLPSDGIPYPLFAFAGLLPWTFFSNAVTNSGNSLIGSANLITKVYFPRAIIPAAAVGAGLVDLAIGFLLLAGLMVYYGVPVTAGLLLVPVLVALTAMLALGVGMWLSALNVKYRDIRYALPFMMQMWMFSSPIIYPPSMLPAKWRWVLGLNPLAGLIDGFRAALFGGRIDWSALGFSACLTLILLAWSSFVFRRMERSFADVV